MEVHCFSCQKSIQIENIGSISRSEECPHCYANIRSCRMCDFYDTSAYNECREPSADRIVEKEKSNFCDYYKLGGGEKAGSQADAAKVAAEALFKK